MKNAVKITLTKFNTDIVRAYRLTKIRGAITVQLSGGKEYRIGDNFDEKTAKQMADMQSYEVTVIPFTK